MKKGLIFTFFLLVLSCFAQAKNNPQPAEETEIFQPIAESENVQIAQPEKLYTITIKKKKFWPILWQDKINGQNYIYALGKAKIGERLTEISALDCSPNLPDDIYAYCAAQIDAKKKLQAYFGKQFFLNLSNEPHPYAGGQYVYVIGKVPAVPIPTEDLPQYLKFANGRFTAIFLTAKVRKHNYLYGLGQAEVKKRTENGLNKAIERAKTNSEANLRRLLGLRELESFVIDDHTSLSDEVETTAWALGRVELE